MWVGIIPMGGVETRWRIDAISNGVKIATNTISY
jgi:hypothetical protein